MDELIPSPAQQMKAEMEVLNDTRRCMIGLAADLYRWDHGTPARRVSDLVEYLPDPGMLISPVDGEPFEIGPDQDPNAAVPK